MMRVYGVVMLACVLMCIAGMLLFQRVGANAYPYDVIAYRNNASRLTLLDLSTRITHILTPPQMTVYELHWSPDGTRLYFLVDDAEGVLHPAVMDADGSNAQYGYNTVINVRQLTGWSSDGDFILYADYYGEGSNAYTSTQWYRLAADDIMQSGEAMSVNSMDVQAFLEIADRRREGIHRASDVNRELVIDQIDGRWAIFMRDDTGTAQIVARVNDTTIFNDGAYALSADGERLLYEVVDITGARQLFIRNIGTMSPPQQIRAYDGYAPTWQP